MRIRKKDKVVVLSGEDKGKTGEVLKVFPDRNRAIVAKAGLVKKHVRPTRERAGGIETVEAPLPLSKLALLCGKCHQPTRPRFVFLSDGSKVRMCRHCGEHIL